MKRNSEKTLRVLTLTALSAAIVFSTNIKSFASNGIVYERGKIKYFDTNGKYTVSSWKEIKGKWYYFDASGNAVVNSWHGNYYLGRDGAMLVNTRTPDGYKVGADGAWIKEAMWKYDSHGKWYVDSTGQYVVSAWKQIDGKWYYFDSYGYAVVNGWVGNYYLGKDGAMLVNTTTPDGYRVGEDGSVIKTSKSKVKVKKGRSKKTTYNSNLKFKDTQEFNNLLNQGLSEDEAELYLLINEYRASIGKKKLRFSKSLTIVARTHVKDSNMYSPENQVDARGIDGNLHSWSANGNWRPVVYTPDHYYAELVWSKPSELTSYKGNGYEISHYYSARVTPSGALNGWKNSKGHNNIIIGAGDWNTLECMGVAIDGHYAHVWFGEDADPAGYYD